MDRIHDLAAAYFRERGDDEETMSMTSLDEHDFVLPRASRNSAHYVLRRGQLALEATGIEFLNHDQPGVRLKAK